MFAADRWARAFAGDLDDHRLEAALDLLKVFTGALSGIHGLLAGSASAGRVDRLFHAVLGGAAPAGAAPGGTAPEGERVCRFLVLLIKKGRFRYANVVIQNIEKILDEQRGILAVSLESAFPLDGDYEDRLKALLREQTGAREIRLASRVVPELLAGCRLQIGSDSLDMSLRTRLQKMTEDLALPVRSAPAGTAAADVSGAVS